MEQLFNPSYELLGSLVCVVSLIAIVWLGKPVKIKDLFARLDTNGDGVLSFDEAKACLAGNVPLPSHRAVFDKYDADRNGVAAPKT